MKKLKILIVIMLLSILTISNKVKAETYTKTSITNATCRSGYNCNSFNNNYVYYTFLQKNVISNENFAMSFDAINVDDYDGFKITVIISEYNQEYFEIYNEYPSVFTWANQTNEGYTITYADGTQAHVSGGAEITGWGASAVNSTNYNYGTINDTTFSYQLGYNSNGNNNAYNQCFMESANDNQITWNCPKTTNGGVRTITGLQLNMRYRTDADMIMYINRFSINLYKSDTNRVITAIQQASSDIVSAINSGNQQIVQQQEETNDKIEEIQNADIPSNSKTPLDDSDYQDYQEKEDDLLESVEDADIVNSVSIPMDIPSNSFVWNTIERLINTNAKVFTYFLSILSIGIIKLVLGR